MGTYFDHFIDREAYHVLLSDNIRDAYYNYVAALPNTTLGDVSSETDRFAERQRKLAAYVGPSVSADLEIQLSQAGFSHWATDAWMGITLDKDPIVLLPGDVHLEYLTPSGAESYLDAFRASYSGSDPDDPYGDLDEGYVAALRRSLTSPEGAFQKRFIQATDHNRVIGVASAFAHEGVAGIYGVGVVPGMRKRGIGRALMDQLAIDLRHDGIHYLFLQTEARSTVEQWYISLGYAFLFDAKYYVKQ